jgi:hypothetical protein
MLWWEQTDWYWELPFYAEMGMRPVVDREDWLAAREQLFAMRELSDEGDLAALDVDFVKNK